MNKLRLDLVKAGHEVWWDQDIEPGRNWPLEVNTAIRRAYAVIICFSEKSELRSRSGIFSELAQAIEIFKTLSPENSVYLIPIRLSECVIPQLLLNENRSFSAIEHLDLFHRNRRQAFNRLLKALEVARGRRF